MREQTLDKQKYLPILIHLGVWAFLFVFPVITYDRFNVELLLMRHWVPLLLSLFLFYSNFFIWVPQFYFNKRYGIFTLINVISFIACILLTYLVLHKLRQLNPDQGGRGHGPKSIMIWSRNLLSYMLALGFSIALRVTSKWREEQEIRKQAENERLKAEVISLKYQLQPHFFFNTLNSIYALIDINKDHAKDMLHKLSKMMRYVLYGGEESFTPIVHEVDFITSYIALMKERFQDQLTVELNMDQNLKGKIPPLLFISLVENAFKHGVDANEKSSIKIHINQQDGRTILRVENKYFPKTSVDGSGSGIGLSNVKKRLDYLFDKDNYNFIHEKRGDYFFASLDIPYEHA